MARIMPENKMVHDAAIENQIDRIKKWHAYFWPFLVAYIAVKIVQIILYPDPYQMSDTSDYLKSAILLRTNPFKPLGYSLFLAFGRLVLPARDRLRPRAYGRAG